MVHFNYYKTADNMVHHVVNHIIRCYHHALRQHGRFNFVLAGGSSPRPVYQQLIGKDIDWSKVEVFIGDERLVPLDHPDSNFGAAKDILLNHVTIPGENLHPVPVHLHYDTVASKYEAEIKNGLGEQSGFHCVLLGLGSDGHTASLYPGHEQLNEKVKKVVYVPKPGMPPHHPRVSMSLPLINASEEVLFIVSGVEKYSLVKEIEDGHGSSFPAAMVDAETCTWYCSK